MSLKCGCCCACGTQSALSHVIVVCGRANRPLNQTGGDSSGCGCLDARRALVSGLCGDALARAVLLDSVELLGSVPSPVVIVVLVVDVMHVIVMDVGALERLVALQVALTAEKHLGLALWIDSHGLADAIRGELVSAWRVRIGHERVAWGDEGVSTVGSWDLSDAFLEKLGGSWQEALTLNDTDWQVVGSRSDHLTSSDSLC